MAKYLDELGLSTLWAKIKSNFVKNTAGEGLHISNGSVKNYIFTSPGVLDVGNGSNRGYYAITTPISPILNQGNYNKITVSDLIDSENLYIIDLSKITSTTSLAYSDDTGDSIVGTLNNYNGDWDNNYTLGYKIASTSAVTGIALKKITYILEVESGWSVLNLNHATSSQIGGVTLSDSADSNNGVSSGIAATPKAVADAIQNAGAATKVYAKVSGDTGLATAGTNNDTIKIIGGTSISTIADEGAEGATDTLTISLDPAVIEVNTTLHTYSFNDSKINNAITASQLKQITNDLDSRIDILEGTVASTFTYKVESDATILSLYPTADNMYIIYFVPISDVADVDGSMGPINAGSNQTYAEYIAVDHGEEATIRYTWERLGTTDVNIDSISTGTIEALN